MQIPSEDPATRKSISMPRTLAKRALKRAKSLGYNFSQYVTHLVRTDLQISASELPRIADEPGREYGKHSLPDTHGRRT